MLSPRQKRFVDEYCIDLNATQAALRAGYSPHTARVQGSKLLTNLDIKAAVDQRIDELQSQKTADAREIMEYLTSVLRGESKSHVLCFVGDGMQTVIDKAPDERERLKAAELLGKRYAMFSDKLNLDGALPVVISGDEDLTD